MDQRSYLDHGPGHRGADGGRELLRPVVLREVTALVDELEVEVRGATTEDRGQDRPADDRRRRVRRTPEHRDRLSVAAVAAIGVEPVLRIDLRAELRSVVDRVVEQLDRATMRRA